MDHRGLLKLDLGEPEVLADVGCNVRVGPYERLDGRDGSVRRAGREGDPCAVPVDNLGAGERVWRRPRGATTT